MKILAGIVAGITLTILVYAMKQPTLDMIFNRDQPRTPADWTPKMRTWTNGILNG